MVSLKVNGNAVATGEVQAGNGTSRSMAGNGIFLVMSGTAGYVHI